MLVGLEAHTTVLTWSCTGARMRFRGFRVGRVGPGRRTGKGLAEKSSPEGASLPRGTGTGGVVCAAGLAFGHYWSMQQP